MRAIMAWLPDITIPLVVAFGYLLSCEKGSSRTGVWMPVPKRPPDLPKAKAWYVD